MIRSIIVFGGMIVYLVATIVPIFIASLVDKSGNVIHIFGRHFGSWILFLSKVKVDVTGLENIEPDRPRIYMSNHQSYYDVFALLGCLRVQFRWMVKKELFQIPLLGFGMSRCGHISIDRRNPIKALESLKIAARRIRNGASVVLFPEGSRSPDGKIKKFKKGGFFLALRAGVPIVPISITGAFSVLPRNQLKITPGTIKIVIDKPIYPGRLSRKERDNLLLKVRGVIVKNFEQYSR